MMRFARAHGAAALALGMAVTAGSCSLTEVTIAPGQDVVVVEAVLRTDVTVQQVLLHRTVDGRYAGGVPGATVVVADSTGRERVFSEGGDCYRIDEGYVQSDSLQFQGTCYQHNPGPDRPDSPQHWVVPGATYTLRVQTPDSRVIRGRTTVPGAFRITSVPPEQEGNLSICSLPPNKVLPLAWTQSAGAWSYVSQLRITGLNKAFAGKGIPPAREPVELRGINVSAADTTILLPTEFGVFERLLYSDELLTAIQGGFPADVQMQLVVAAADRNWVNSVRGGSFNPSGQVRISSVVGDGVGVFGSLVPHSAIILVTSHSALPVCGH